MGMRVHRSIPNRLLKYPVETRLARAGISRKAQSTRSSGKWGDVAPPRGRLPAPSFLSGRTLPKQGAHSHEIVGSRGEREDPSHLGFAPMPELGK